MLILVTAFFIIMILNKNLEVPLEEVIVKQEKSSFDITNPSFTINNNKEKISVKAENGKFLDKNLILLQNNVIFKSTQFKLLTNKVIFDQHKTRLRTSSVDLLLDLESRIEVEIEYRKRHTETKF